MAVPFVQLLSTNGDGTGTTEITGDYIGAAETFELHGSTAVGDATIVERIMIFVEDTGIFGMEIYGAGSALTNGLTLDVTDSAGSSIIDLTPVPIKSNGQWGAYCYDVRVDTWGVGDEALQARWTFTKFTNGAGIWLDDGAKLVLTANDTLTGLVSHRVTCQGFRQGKTWNY